jgi:hypothetical protein
MPGKSLPDNQGDQGNAIMQKRGVFAAMGTTLSYSPAIFARCVTALARCLEGRDRYFRETPHFLHHGHQWVDLHRASTFEILQHRGLVKLARAFDAPLDIVPVL